MLYQFVRMQDDGKISSMSPHKSFNTIGDAKCMAPTLLATRRTNGAGKIVLIEVLEIVTATANVRYEPFGVKGKV